MPLGTPSPKVLATGTSGCPTGYAAGRTGSRRNWPRPRRKRYNYYNQHVRDVADKYGAVLVDYWCLGAFHDRRMWDSDRLHKSKAGHKYLAGQVLDQLGVPHKIRRKDWEPRARASVREWERQQRRWIHDWVLPLFGRKLRGVTLGDALGPRWQDPVKVPRKGGLKKLAGASHGRPREY